LNQTSANWILTNVRKLLCEAFVVAEAMIKEVPLPFYAGELRSNSFVIANQWRKGVAAINADQRMQMIRHEQEKVQIPSAVFVINPCGIKKHDRGFFIAKLLCPALLTADRDEIHRAESPRKMRYVIESFTEYTWHCGNHISRHDRMAAAVHLNRLWEEPPLAIEVNRPYLPPTSSRAFA
jgi:hypothetical protein